MSKIICEFCGTSYPETEAQCPICGCVRTVDENDFLGLVDKQTTTQEYHHVKGGRFSEKNVRKRNGEVPNEAPTVPNPDKSKKEKNSSNKGLLITIFILLIAIVAVIAYIVLVFFMPDFIGADKPSDSVIETQEVETTVDLSCKEILLDVSEYTFEEIGAEMQLIPILIPQNTTDNCTYFTDNDAVATVTSSGLVTAISSGEANIKITCGNATLICKIIVLEPQEAFALTYTELTFTNAGESCNLYEGQINKDEIIWASDDESIAYVEDCQVISVGPGVTTIYASYNGETLSCSVNCDFEAPTEETKAPIVDNGPYKLKNVFGFSNSDVTIRVGESFTLILVDKYGDKVDGVSWSVVDGSTCKVKDGVVTGESTGKSTVVATFNGKEYTCIVRVS